MDKLAELKNTLLQNTLTQTQSADVITLTPTELSFVIMGVIALATVFVLFVSNIVLSIK